MHFPTTTPSPSARLAVRDCEDGDIIDAALLPVVAGLPWRLDVRGYTCTADGRGGHLYLHQLVAGTLTAPSGIHTHHRNGNQRDNRRANLEAMPKPLHSRITRLEQGPGRWGYKGVKPVRGAGGATLWGAQARRPEGGSAWLGTHSTPEEAARAFDRWVSATYFNPDGTPREAGIVPFRNFPPRQEAQA